MIDPTARIDSGAQVEDGVEIGARSTVAHGALVRTGARAGADVVIDRNALVDRGVVLEDGALIGPSAILTNDRYPRAIALTRDVDAAASSSPPREIVVRHGATVGASSVVVAGIEIGTFGLVGAGAVVTRDVPAHALVVGNPARRIGWVCACGMRLVDSNGDPAPAQPAHYSRDSALHCPSCGRVYTYVPDAETVEEASGPREGLPA